MSRQGLKRLYGLSLTLALLLALLSALSLAIVFSERLSAPLSVLAAGTRAVAQGDFSQRHPVRSHDELGILTESFNTMTTQLAEARAALLRNQDQLEAAKAYLESILAKLSAGVLSFDSERRLRSANPSAERSWVWSCEPFMGISLDEWGAHDARLAEIGSAILGAIDRVGSRAWEEQMEFGPGREEGAAAARVHAASRQRERFRAGVRRHHPPAAGATLRRLGRGGAAPGARDQEPAHADPALGRTPHHRLADKLARRTPRC